MRKIGAIKQKRINALIILLSMMISISIIMSIPDREMILKDVIQSNESHLEPVPDTDYLLYIPSTEESRIRKFTVLDEIRKE